MVAPRFARIYGSATLTMLVSSAPISVPTVTAIVTTHGFTGGGGVVSGETGAARGGAAPTAMSAPGGHGGVDRHADPQGVAGVGAGVDGDPDRHALHDLGEVAGRVLRREQTED